MSPLATSTARSAAPPAQRPGTDRPHGGPRRQGAGHRLQRRRAAGPPDPRARGGGPRHRTVPAQRECLRGQGPLGDPGRCGHRPRGVPGPGLRLRHPQSSPCRRRAIRARCWNRWCGIARHAIVSFPNFGHWAGAPAPDTERSHAGHRLAAGGLVRDAEHPLLHDPRLHRTPARPAGWRSRRPWCCATTARRPGCWGLSGAGRWPTCLAKKRSSA